MKHHPDSTLNRVVSDLDNETADGVVISHAEHTIAAKRLGQKVLKRDTIRLLLQAGLQAVKAEGWPAMLQRLNGSAASPPKKAAAAKRSGD